MRLSPLRLPLPCPEKNNVPFLATPNGGTQLRRCDTSLRRALRNVVSRSVAYLCSFFGFESDKWPCRGSAQRTSVVCCQKPADFFSGRMDGRKKRTRRGGVAGAFDGDDDRRRGRRFLGRRPAKEQQLSGETTGGASAFGGNDRRRGGRIKEDPSSEGSSRCLRLTRQSHAPPHAGRTAARSSARRERPLQQRSTSPRKPREQPRSADGTNRP